MTSETLDTLVENALRGQAPKRTDALTVLADSIPLLDLVAAVSRVRRAFFGTRVKLNTIINMKSGLCPEDCSYCSQRVGSKSEVLKYSWISPNAAADIATQAVKSGAKRVCLVASGRGPSDRDIARVTDTIAKIKEQSPHVEICACLGLLADGQAGRLLEAGAFAYSHNLNTSEARYADICTTHTYADRVTTLASATSAGLSPCSGAIFGMGETDEEIVDLAEALHDLNPDSVPVNFLIPFEGTPLERRWELTPSRCLRILALFRLYFPSAEVRLAGGREIHLRSLQPLALHLANSIFLGDYLTSEGQPGSDDRAMIADAGLEIEGLAATESGECQPHHLVKVRRRGAGTDTPANS